MLSYLEFKILIQCLNTVTITQEIIVEITKSSLEIVDDTIQNMIQKGWLNEKLQITSQGLEALKPYKVKNAIIMAAGMSSRFAPLSYEKPKALLNVKGEILIEREIRQLQEKGITDITLVVGYRKEQMYYLADKYKIDLVINEDYYRYNNTSTLMLITEKLDNTYLCSSDNYFVENPFEPYVYRSYYSAVYEDGETEEYCLTVNEEDRITSVSIGGKASWYMVGHVYFDREFSKKFVAILKKEYKNSWTKEQLWENLYLRYIKELDLYIRRYDVNLIKEFDSLEDLRKFDKDYLRHSNSKIFLNICKILHCKEQEIIGIHPTKTGLTNLSFQFTCKGKSYVYRHPGVGTDAYINRASEAESMQIAKKLHLDDTFLYIDPKEGWKLSYYIEQARTLNYHKEEEVKKALSMLNTLHQSGARTSQVFDIYKEICKFEAILEQSHRTDFEDMPEMSKDIKMLYELVEKDGIEKCLCHCDSYNPNFLLDTENKMYLIDWEYSGMSDPGCDLGTFIACSDYSIEQADRILELYLGHEPNCIELRHYIAYIAIAAFYWFIWALYQDSLGKNVGSYQYLWYRCTKKYSKRALKLYHKLKMEKKLNMEEK